MEDRTYGTSGGFAGDRSGQVLYDQLGRLVLLQAVAEAPDSAVLLRVLLQAVAEAPDSAVLLRVLLQAVAEAANTIGSVSRADVVRNLAAVFPVSRPAVLDRDAIHNSSF
jgi:hypothetical protein